MGETTRKRSERNENMANVSLRYNEKKAREYTKNGGKPARWKIVDGKHVFDGYEK